MGKGFFLYPKRGLPWPVTGRNGQSEIGHLEASLNFQRFFIRFIPSFTRFFSLLTGRLLMAHNAKMEAQPFMPAFERTIRVNSTSFTSNNVVPRTKPRIHQSELKGRQPKTEIVRNWLLIPSRIWYMRSEFFFDAHVGSMKLPFLKRSPYAYLMENCRILL